MRLREDTAITCPMNYIMSWYSFLSSIFEECLDRQYWREKAEDYDHQGEILTRKKNVKYIFKKPENNICLNL